MQKWLFKILICSVNVFVLASILPGVEVKDIFSAVLVAVVLSVLDVLVKPLLILLTLPATIFTLGLFLFVINACIILIDDHFVHGFEVTDFWHALIFGALLSFFNGLANGKVKVSVHKNNEREQ
jgi:putative membrane protein